MLSNKNSCPCQGEARRFNLLHNGIRIGWRFRPLFQRLWRNDHSYQIGHGRIVVPIVRQA